MSDVRTWVAGDEIEQAIARLLWGDLTTYGIEKKPPRYSRDPRAAIHVIEGLTQDIGKPSTRTFSLTISPYDPAQKDCYWHCAIDDDEGYDGEASAETMAMAVCLAILNFHEAEDS
jgi:hypothetical protein